MNAELGAVERVEHAHMHCTAQRRVVSCEYVGVISAIQPCKDFYVRFIGRP